MRALVTGATGFLGYHICAALKKCGYDVAGLVRHTSNYSGLKELQIELRYGSLDDPASLLTALKNCDYIFHSAGLIKATHPDQFFRANHLGTRNLLKAALALINQGQKIQRFIYLSSLAASGPSRDGHPMDEQTPSAPITAYGHSKLAGEQETLKFRDLIPVTVIRPPAIFGPRDRQFWYFFRMVKRGFVPKFTKQSVLLSLAYVKNLVAGILLAAENPRAIGEIFFLADARPYTTSEVIEAMAQALQVQVKEIYIPRPVLYSLAFTLETLSKISGIPTRLNRDRVRDLTRNCWVVSIEKARQTLGYQPLIALEESISETARWYKQAGWL